jgi:hypothetical protein
MPPEKKEKIVSGDPVLPEILADLKALKRHDFTKEGSMITNNLLWNRVLLECIRVVNEHYRIPLPNGTGV